MYHNKNWKWNVICWFLISIPNKLLTQLCRGLFSSVWIVYFFCFEKAITVVIATPIIKPNLMRISVTRWSAKEGTDHTSKSFLTELRAYKQNAVELWRLILCRLLNRSVTWTVREFLWASGLKWNITDTISANIRSRKGADIKYYSHNFHLIPLANQSKVPPLLGLGCPEPTEFQGRFKFFHTKDIAFGSFLWIKWDISNRCNSL